MNSPRHESHDDTVVEILRANPEFANEYFATGLEEAELLDGQTGLLTVPQHIVEAQGMSSVAARAGIPRESLNHALCPEGNLTIMTFLAVVRGAGLHLEVSRCPAQA